MPAESDCLGASRATKERPASDLEAAGLRGGEGMQLEWTPRSSIQEGNQRFYYTCREDEELMV